MAGSPCARVAGAAGGLEELGRDGDRGEVLAGLAQQDRVRLVQAVDGRALRAVDLGPLVAEAVAAVALGQRRPLPDAGRAAGELADQARPVVDLRGGAGLAVGRHGPAGRTGRRRRRRGAIGPSRSMAKSIRWIVMSNRSPAPALSLYCRQPQLVSGQSRNRCERKCRGVPRAPVFQEVPQVAHRRGEAVREGRHVDDARVAGRLVHRADLAGVQPERLLAHDVLARPRRRHGDRRVGEVGRGDDDRVDVAVVQRSIGVGGGPLDPPLRPRRSSRAGSASQAATSSARGSSRRAGTWW